MRHPRWSLVVALLAAAFLLAIDRSAPAAETLDVQPGDRVVLVGNTLIERAQLYNYVELAITSRVPNVTFRNLGWSGDTVRGEARAYFGSPEDGFNHLRDHVHELEPDVILVGYGLNASYRGEDGLDTFNSQLRRLLEMLAETDARLVLLSPLPHEQETSPLPDVSPANANIRLYRDALADAAEEAGHAFVDLYDLIDDLQADPSAPLTSNGLHLTATGYYHLAAALEHGLGWGERTWRIDINANEVEQAAGVTVADLATEGDTVRFNATDDLLPLDMPEADAPAHSNYLPPRVLRVTGLEAGDYQLTIDDKPIATADAERWAEGVTLTAGPAFAQAAELREQIGIKNLFFFHQYRPQNETYIRGFRDHEQGQHIKDLPKFDPLIAEREAEIQKLREPATHTYTLERIE